MEDSNTQDDLDTKGAAIMEKLTNELLNPNDTKKLLKTALQKRLSKYQKSIKLLKENGASYNAIIEMIHIASAQAGSPLIVSTQAIRSYCQNILGFEPNPRPRKNKDIEKQES